MRPACFSPSLASVPGDQGGPTSRALLSLFPQCQGCQSFFSKWGTIPLSSGLGLPGPSVSLRPSSASWDKYFCGGKRGTKEEERVSGDLVRDPLACLPSSSWSYRTRDKQRIYLFPLYVSL